MYTGFVMSLKHGLKILKGYPYCQSYESVDNYELKRVNLIQRT